MRERTSNMLAHFGVHYQIHVALAIAHVEVLQTVELFGQRAAAHLLSKREFSGLHADISPVLRAEHHRPLTPMISPMSRFLERG